MAFDPENKTDISQLSRAVGYSWGCLEPFRENRRFLMREVAGRHYSANGSTDRVPVNLIELAMNIYLQRLVASNPAVSITTDYQTLKEISTRFEMAMNHLVKEISLDNTLEMAVVGAMLSMGVVKVGLNRTHVEVGGVLHDSGQPFADYVSLDNWVHDMTATTFENDQYEGDFYTPTIDEAYEIFPSKVHGKLNTIEEQVLSRPSDHDLSEGSSTQRQEFRPLVRCLDLWLPKQNLVLQCQASDDNTNPISDVLNIIEWEGPERGPYHKLGFTKIENNTMPIAPAMHWRDLHELSNELYCKLSRQAVDEKTVHAYRPGGESDADAVRDGEDGDWVPVNDPSNVSDIRSGGLSQESLAFFLGAKDLYTYLAGNLDMLGGLGPQSETLGQDQLLNASASMRIQRMQKAVESFTEGIIQDLAFYLWTDPYINIPLVKRVKGFEDVAINVDFGPEDRESDFLEYNIRIEPYSMQHKTPEARAQGLRTLLSEMILPLIPMMQQQGIVLNVENLFKKVGKLTDITEINDIITYTKPDISQPVGEPPQKSPVTTRRYERINRPGATNSGKSQILQQAALGGKPQASEAASLFRPTG